MVSADRPLISLATLVTTILVACVPAGSCARENERERRQVIISRQVVDGMLLFRQERGRCPGSLEELVPLHLKEVPYDAWGRRMRVIVEGSTCALLSAGPDGTFGSRDDVRMVLDP